MNTRFAVAVHIVTLLDAAQGDPVTSDVIAGSVGTNPSLIRRLMGPLTEAGLIQAQRGAGGGAQLARPADTITLLDIYRAVADTADVLPIHETANPKCPIGRHIQQVLEEEINRAESALQRELGRTTVADLRQRVITRHGEPTTI